MADPALNIPRMTAKEYLEVERNSPIRHEFVDGVVYAMTGTTRNHDLISGDIFGVLLGGLRPPCTVYSANLKVQVETQDTEAFYYPDVHVTCSDLDNNRHWNSMPVLVIEVASDSTADYDRGTKFASYRKLPSLQEYVIALQTKPYVEVFRKRTNWHAEAFGEADTLTLESVDLTMPVAHFYRRVKF